MAKQPRQETDEPVFDLGGGRKITVGQLAGWNTGSALSPNFDDDRREAPRLAGTIVRYSDKANMGSFVERSNRERLHLLRSWTLVSTSSIKEKNHWPEPRALGLL